MSKIDRPALRHGLRSPIPWLFTLEGACDTAIAVMQGTPAGIATATWALMFFTFAAAAVIWRYYEHQRRVFRDEEYASHRAELARIEQNHRDRQRAEVIEWGRVAS